MTFKKGLFDYLLYRNHDLGLLPALLSIFEIRDTLGGDNSRPVLTHITHTHPRTHCIAVLGRQRYRGRFENWPCTVGGLSTAEQTGSSVFRTLWSYVLGAFGEWLTDPFKKKVSSNDCL